MWHDTIPCTTHHMNHISLSSGKEGQRRSIIFHASLDYSLLSSLQDTLSPSREPQPWNPSAHWRRGGWKERYRTKVGCFDSRDESVANLSSTKPTSHSPPIINLYKPSTHTPFFHLSVSPTSAIGCLKKVTCGCRIYGPRGTTSEEGVGGWGRWEGNVEA